jgi:hypothetical protein
MKSQTVVFCSICGEPRRGDDSWFLLTENRWTDRLKILRWNDQLGHQLAAYPACSVAHVQQLVVHWMAVGSLAHPFARIPAESGYRKRNRRGSASDDRDLDTQGAKILGELSVHRESLSRILVENPESLASILEALISALSTHRPTYDLERDAVCPRVYEFTEV